jgi:hypothetical protein
VDKRLSGNLGAVCSLTSLHRQATAMVPDRQGVRFSANPIKLGDCRPCRHPIPCVADECPGGMILHPQLRFTSSGLASR